MAWRAEEHHANLPIPLRAMPEGVRANRNYFRTRGGEAKMSEMWDQEGLGCAGSRLRGDIKKELKTPSLTITFRRHLRFDTTFYRFVIGIVRCLPIASGRLGTLTFNMPLSKLASTLSSATVSGSRNERWKLP
jgi:hypothetical protein